MEQSLKHFHPSRRTLSRPQLELVRCYEFTTYGQHREVKVDRTYHAFRVYVDDNAVATAECELEEMLLPIEIDVQGGPPLQGLLSAHTLSVNEFIIEPRWTQEHGDIPDMAILEVAECQPGAPSEIRIPSARSQAKSSWEEQAEQQAIPPATSYQHVQMPDDPLADTRLKYGAVAFPEGEFALARAELVGDGFGALIEPSLRRTSARSPQVQVGHLRLVPTDDTRPFEDAQQIPELYIPETRQMPHLGFGAVQEDQSSIPESKDGQRKPTRNLDAHAVDQELSRWRGNQSRRCGTTIALSLAKSYLASRSMCIR
eukprot:CAMPEP_0169384374 /NCGR_PEP_ID=MMETSP1017-20121227/43389_1 /TAXON_ID=342587 /ORGANISM="Karlodinium micrum, Strain CCMP2283" /LENGTH=313 /DNA_ID=CAMNT_0009484919 /DNA_START=91 /DNA_END=1030 /DNA_ORIENTATION=+